MKFWQAFETYYAFKTVSACDRAATGIFNVIFGLFGKLFLWGCQLAFYGVLFFLLVVVPFHLFLSFLEPAVLWFMDFYDHLSENPIGNGIIFSILGYICEAFISVYWKNKKQIKKDEAEVLDGKEENQAIKKAKFIECKEVKVEKHYDF